MRIDAAKLQELRRRRPMADDCALWAALAALLWAPGSFAGHAYAITQLGDDPAVTFVPHAINDRGDVVGDVLTPQSTGFATSAFLWRHGNFIDLGNLGGGDSFATAQGINDRGEIVGRSRAPSGMRGFLWRNGKMTDLGDLPGGDDYSDAVAINNRGEIVGSSCAAEGCVAVLWVDGQMVELGTLPGGAVDSRAVAVNRWGAIVGTSSVADVTVDDGGFRYVVHSTHAFLWRSGELIDIGILPGAASSAAAAINDRGTVVAVSSFPGLGAAGNTARAFTWRFGRIRVLPVVDPAHENYSLVKGSTDRGQMVGETGEVDGGLHTQATLWEGSVACYLVDRIKSDDPLKQFVNLTSAVAINDRGQIIATGYDSRVRPLHGAAYLLTPTH